MVDTIYAQLEFPENGRPTSVRRKEGEFIYRFLKENKIKRTLEIGFGYGCSAAYIVAATESMHYVIDAYQEESFNNLGFKNMERLGLHQLINFQSELSHYALPKLAQQDVKVDFAFIDGGHRFDEVFCDFYFVDLILEQNGYALFHDTWMRSTQHVASWIKKNKKNYTVVETQQPNLFLVQKNGSDNRSWYHFVGFGTVKSWFTQWRFDRTLKDPYSI